MTIQEKKILFGHNRLHAQTKSLDCGGTGINGDMYKTLKADEIPYIIIELQEILLLNELQQNIWIPAIVNVYFTIAGTRRHEECMIEILKQSEKNFELKGKHKIYLTNYRIKPPKAMLGLINVENEIELRFDLSIQASPQ
ncbi:MAG: hypothetical protein ACK4IY_09405 [Chitinophagales bacterium]